MQPIDFNGIVQATLITVIGAIGLILSIALYYRFRKG